MIFISIDDNEIRNLRSLCDEILGEDNFIGIFSVNSTPNARDYGHIGKMHEYVLFYAKNVFLTNSFQIPEVDKNFKYKDDISGFNIHPLYNSNVAFTSKNRPNLYYPFYLHTDSNIEHSFYEISLTKRVNAVEVYPPKSVKDNVQFVWRWGKDKSQRELNKEIIGYKTDNGEYRIVQKMRHSSKLIRSLLVDKKFSSRRGTAEVEGLFGMKMFQFPKPVELLKQFIMVSAEEDDIVLDLFAGSATTAHATLSLNSDDKKNRNFIMVQLPEPCEDDTETDNSEYGTIADIGKERIRRVIKKIEKEQAERANDAKGDLLTAKEDQPKLDLGFKVLKLDKSNFSIWDGSEPETSVEKISEQLDSHIDHIDTKASQEDILYELLLKAGFKPTERVEQKEFSGKTVFSIAEGLLLICLEDEITKELIDAIAEAEPMQFICLDRGFKGNDQLKTNAVQTFAARNQGRDKTEQIIFRTI